MKKLILFLALLSMQQNLLSRDFIAEMKQRDRERAAYWSMHGYSFDPTYMSAAVMDMKVLDIKRAAYWKGQGYIFDPTYMSAAVMDMKVSDIKRAAYWKEQGYVFDPTYMSAAVMDMKVSDIKRAAYWKEQGYVFDPTYMSAAVMDMKVSDIKRAAYWKERGYNFDPAYTSAAVMDWQVSKAVAVSNQSPQNSPSSYTSSQPAIRSAPQLSMPLFSMSVATNYSNDYNSNRRYDSSYRPWVGDHYVAPHIRSDGSFVQGHMKTDSDDSFWNNWSSSGNINPYTGSTGSKLPPYSFRTYTAPKLPSISMPKLPSYGGTSRVSGYIKSNGTYVSPHYRSK